MVDTRSWLTLNIVNVIVLYGALRWDRVHTTHKRIVTLAAERLAFCYETLARDNRVSCFIT